MKNKMYLFVGVLLSLLVFGWFFILSPHQEKKKEKDIQEKMNMEKKLQLETVARMTCNSLNGFSGLENSPKISVGQVLTSAIQEAEKLEYTGGDLGNQMKQECPQIIYKAEDWSQKP